MTYSSFFLFFIQITVAQRCRGHQYGMTMTEKEKKIQIYMKNNG